MKFTKKCRIWKNENVCCPKDPLYCPGISCPVYNGFMLDRLYSDDASMLLVSWHAIPQAPRFHADMWYQKLLILKPEAMKKYSLPLRVEYQIFFAETGPGCLKHNPVGEIDGHLLYTREKYTFIRSDFYGIPEKRAMQRYEEVVRMIARYSK